MRSSWTILAPKPYDSIGYLPSTLIPVNTESHSNIVRATVLLLGYATKEDFVSAYIVHGDSCLVDICHTNEDYPWYLNSTLWEDIEKRFGISWGLLREKSS